MPYDRNGDFWRPVCGVRRCFYRRCFMYSRGFGKCFFLAMWNTEKRVEEAMNLQSSIKEATPDTTANITRSLPQKPIFEGKVAKAHAEQAKPVKLETILIYDE